MCAFTDTVLGLDLENMLQFIVRYLKFIVRLTYDNDLQHAKISFGNIIR